MKRIAIIGASYLQCPLIERAKEMGMETHVFAWQVGDEGEEIADYYYPISIVEKEQILKKCVELKIDGICTIASDLAVVTVNYVAEKMGLTGNSIHATKNSTNKYYMRMCFEKNGDPSPKSILVDSVGQLKDVNLHYPVIIKPLDRSGSRGVTKLDSQDGLENAIEYALDAGFEKKVLIEEFVEGQEYSVECISWKGNHRLLSITKKYTTGFPHFIEMAHLEPAICDDELVEKIENIVFHALDSLELRNGASHTEIKIHDGEIKIIETAGRMGGDFIGSHLVEMTTQVDFLKAVIQVALGINPDIKEVKVNSAAAVRFIFGEEDLKVLKEIQEICPEYLVCHKVENISNQIVEDSSMRNGFFLLKAENVLELKKYLDYYGQ